MATIRKVSSILLPLLLPMLLVASSERRVTHERLQGALWIQTSAEYQMTTTQIYGLAKEKLDAALRDPSWTAALEQEVDYSQLPPAVIVDVDETVLDNSAFQARLVRNDSDYQSDMWRQWVLESKARATPGALDFAKYASEKGVMIFYVTNRKHDVENATMRNLQHLEFPLQGGEKQVLLRGEQEDWGPDKSSRRRYLAKVYRILLLVGDDLNDFVSGAMTNPEQRIEVATKFRSYWGEKWILIPNPLYGSWEGAIYDFEFAATDKEKLGRKYKRLETLED